MSAFLVSDKHLNILATAATKDHGRLFIDGMYRSIEQRDDKVAQRVLEILLQENVRSLATRYPKDDNTVTVPMFKRVYQLPTAVEILKACDCYDYQACENDDYELTEAAGIVDAVRRSAIHDLPGYDKAEWGF